MTGHVIGLCLEAADHKGVAVIHNPVELTAISPEALILIKNVTEGVLYRRDFSTDRNVSPEFCLDVGRTGEVIGVDMCLEDAVNSQTIFPNVSNQTICGAGREGS